MTPTTEISASQIKKSVFLTGIGSAVFFIVFFIAMQLLNLIHVTELRLVNYVVLFLAGFYQLKRLFDNGKTRVSYLQGFGTVFFTGIFSYLIFALFLYFYVRLDHQLEMLFWENIPIDPIYSLPLPFITIFFEGSAISIIVALILMQYYRKYEEGEDHLFQIPSQKTDFSKQ